MTPQEIDRIENAIRHIESSLDVDPWAAEIAVEAMRKQIPMKPEYTRLLYQCNGVDEEVKHPECPYCRNQGLILWSAEISKGSAYCKRCGQAIVWEE